MRKGVSFWDIKSKAKFDYRERNVLEPRGFTYFVVILRKSGQHRRDFSKSTYGDLVTGIAASILA